MHRLSACLEIYPDYSTVDQGGARCNGLHHKIGDTLNRIRHVASWTISIIIAIVSTMAGRLNLINGGLIWDKKTNGRYLSYQWQ